MSEEKLQCRKCKTTDSNAEIRKDGRDKYGNLRYICRSCWENQWED